MRKKTKRFNHAGDFPEFDILNLGGGKFQAIRRLASVAGKPSHVN